MKVRQCKQNGCRNLIPYENDYCDAHRALNETRLRDEQQQEKALQSISQGYRASERHTRYAHSARADELRHSFYQSSKWKRLSQRIKIRDLYLDSIDNNSYDKNEIIVDHIVPRLVAPELAMNESNLWLLNRRHHNQKTRIEQQMSHEKLMQMSKDDWIKMLKN